MLDIVTCYPLTILIPASPYDVQSFPLWNPLNPCIIEKNMKNKSNVEAFDHDPMTITILDVFGCVESCAKRWDILARRRS